MISWALPTINNHVPLSINESFRKKKLPIKNHTAISTSLNAPRASYRRCITKCSCPISRSHSLSCFTHFSFAEVVIGEMTIKQKELSLNPNIIQLRGVTYTKKGVSS